MKNSSGFILILVLASSSVISVGLLTVILNWEIVLVSAGIIENYIFASSSVAKFLAIL